MTTGTNEIHLFISPLAPVLDVSLLQTQTGVLFENVVISDFIAAQGDIVTFYLVSIGFLVSAMPEDKFEKEVRLNLGSLCCYG